MVRMAKISDVKVPGVGSMNILNPRDWLSMILGIVMLIIVAATAQNVTRAVGNKVPMVDTSIEQPWQSPKVMVDQQKMRVV